MRRTFGLALAISLLLASLAFASPDVNVDYRQGVPTIRLEGSYPGSRYTISRARAAAGDFEPITATNVLCTGECSVDDYAADPGATYWYRFELDLADGSSATYGPFPVTISAEQAWRVHAQVSPNPVAANARIDLFLTGAPGSPPLVSDAALFDLQGRLVKSFHRGTLARGRTQIDWDGRDRNGRALGAGVYYLRFATPLGTSVLRVVRAR